MCVHKQGFAFPVFPEHDFRSYGAGEFDGTGCLRQFYSKSRRNRSYVGIVAAQESVFAAGVKNFILYLPDKRIGYQNRGGMICKEDFIINSLDFADSPYIIN